MKTFPLLLFASAALLTACSHGRDEAVRRSLPGDWHVEMAGGGKSESTYSPNGDFKCHVNYASGNEMTMGGKYEVIGGFLVETVTNISPSLVMRFKIIQSNDRELVVEKDGVTTTIIKIRNDAA
jgi:hypothetical protein